MTCVYEYNENKRSIKPRSENTRFPIVITVKQQYNVKCLLAYCVDSWKEINTSLSDLTFTAATIKNGKLTIVTWINSERGGVDTSDGIRTRMIACDVQHELTEYLRKNVNEEIVYRPREVAFNDYNEMLTDLIISLHFSSVFDLNDSN